MYKIIYWSKKLNRIQVVMFSLSDDLLDFMASHYDDMDQEAHFVKIVKE